MGKKKIGTQYPGVRYYEHPRRKTRSGQPDRYFSIRYRLDGRLVEEGLGWSSESWNAEKAHGVLAQIKAGQRTGSGPVSVAELRAQGEARRKEAAEAARRDAAMDITLATFFREYYLPRVKTEKRTWRDDWQRFNKYINPVLGGVPLRAIKKTDVQALIDAQVATGAAAATVGQYMAIIRHAYNIAAEIIIDDQPLFSGQNPATGLRLPKIHNARTRFLTAAEADLLIAAAEKMRCLDLHDAIVLSLNTGLRLGELRRLQWLDVDMIHGFVTVHDEDMRKPSGTVPMNGAAAAVFKRRLENKGTSQLVIPPIFGEEYRQDLSRDFGRLVDRLGLNTGIAPDDRQRRLVFHSLRHTFASWLALAGADIYRIKTLMRHKTIAMTMRYAHLIPDATRDAVHNLRPPINP
ncbi:MAG: site-specific integrase [Desulfobulbaceae bacterium]|nr:site-specific integrase [Desulfobulbaceae bacterium]